MSTQTPEQGPQRPTRQIRVQRTYLIQRIQEWVVEIPADYDTDEWLANDAAGFDQYISDNGNLVSEYHHRVEHDDLETEVLS